MLLFCFFTKKAKLSGWQIAVFDIFGGGGMLFQFIEKRCDNKDDFEWGNAGRIGVFYWFQSVVERQVLDFCQYLWNPAEQIPGADKGVPRRLWEVLLDQGQDAVVLVVPIDINDQMRVL